MSTLLNHSIKHKERILAVVGNESEAGSPDSWPLKLSVIRL